MIELDYAFLADFASVQEGKLTAVGASFTRLRVPSVPAQINLSIAGRIRTSVDVETIQLKVRIDPPGGTYQLDGTAVIEKLDSEPYAEGLRGTLFSVQLGLPLPEFGLYTVLIDLEGTKDVDRTLKFEVEQA